MSNVPATARTKLLTSKYHLIEGAAAEEVWL